MRSSSDSKIKILLLQPILAHYRRDIFNHLMESEQFDFHIAGGRQYQGIAGIVDTRYKYFDYISFALLGHRFYYLKGVMRYMARHRPEVVISSGVDFHLIHTILIFFIFRIIMRKKFIWWSHATYGRQGTIGRWIRTFFYYSSSGVLSYNNEGRDNLLRMGVKDKNIQVANNALNTIDYGFASYDVLNRPTNTIFTILYCGRVTSAKKVDLLIESLALLKDKSSFHWRCIIVGSGELDHLKTLANKFGLTDRIVFTGAKYGVEAHPYFLRSDILVCPGGIGLTILHATSFGLPVITSDNPAIHGPEAEILTPSFNGDYFQDDSPEALAEKILEWEKKLLSNKKEIARNCIDQIYRHGYLPDSVAGKILDIVKTQLESRHIHAESK